MNEPEGSHLIRVKFLRAHKDFKPGDVTWLSAGLTQQLVEMGIVVEVSRDNNPIPEHH